MAEFIRNALEKKVKAQSLQNKKSGLQMLADVAVDSGITNLSEKIDDYLYT